MKIACEQIWQKYCFIILIVKSRNIGVKNIIYLLVKKKEKFFFLIFDHLNLSLFSACASAGAAIALYYDRLRWKGTRELISKQSPQPKRMPSNYMFIGSNSLIFDLI